MLRGATRHFKLVPTNAFRRKRVAPVPARSELFVILYATVLAGVAAGLALVGIATGASWGPLAPLLALSVLALCAESRSVRVSSTTELSVSFLPFVLTAVVFGPLAAMTVGMLSLL